VTSRPPRHQRFEPLLVRSPDGTVRTAINMPPCRHCGEHYLWHADEYKCLFNHTYYDGQTTNAYPEP
jgi:hypothetical protein